MSAATGSRHIGRSAGAVLIGIVVGVVLSLGTDAILRKLGVFPALGVRMAGGLLLLATVYRTLYGVASSYLTARFAPNRPMGHALVLGLLGFVVSTAGAVATWNSGPAYGPHWYPVALIVLALPTAWVGGKLRVLQLGGATL
jgi:hypothetical protein